VNKCRVNGLAKHFFRASRRKDGAIPEKLLKIALDYLSESCRLRPHSTKTMKSKRNLTRFTYESAAFEGWRLCISRAGTTFTKYFPDKKFGGGKKSLAAAEKTLAELKTLIEGAKRVDGKLTPATIKKGEKLLLEAF
jgi:hypothetical protein